MEVGGKLEIISYQSYDPLVTRVRLTEGAVEKGHYLPDLGVVEQIWRKTDEGYQEINDASGQGDYVIRTHVSEKGFIRLKPALQFNILKQLTDRVHAISCVLTETYSEKEGLSSDEVNEKVLAHRGKGDGGRFNEEIASMLGPESHGPEPPKDAKQVLQIHNNGTQESL
jgi:hypothetical protein